MKTTLTAALLGVALLTGCGEQNENAPWIIGQGGMSQDVWLYGGTFSSTPVALVFGYADDMEACLNLVVAYKLLYPANNNYFCSRRQL